MFAQVDKNGNICATTSLEVLGSMPEGITQIEVPDDTDALRHKIDLATMEVVDLPPPPPPIPDVNTQLMAALINAGMLKAADFHPTTIATANARLEAVGMEGINAEPKAPAAP